MGTDIHGVVQVLENGRWVTKCEGYRDRNYNAFGVLANVRNGRGFGGVYMGSGFRPIAEPRGLPKDFDIADDDTTVVPFEPAYADEGDVVAAGGWRYCMGDHSFSYVTLAELQAVNWHEGVAIMRGLVEEPVYQKWVKGGKVRCPESWCGAVGGFGTRTMTEEQYNRYGGQATGHRLFIECHWTETYADACGRFYDWVTVTLPALGEPDKVRFVFGFDS